VELEKLGEINVSEQFSQSNGSLIFQKKLGEARWSWWLPADWSL